MAALQQKFTASLGSVIALVLSLMIFYMVFSMNYDVGGSNSDAVQRGSKSLNLRRIQADANPIDD